ncbi:hypothetical protein L211DRAFT_496314 [Terfezia boudieri ATCC MYA-4762]|uniref:Uncharacterized protein n=1 Tax=Terfezia boudieri ATCC MYA-4762 TaxID=1051890 RepID=A0A3N4LJK2_9PEZI|nr:hypothetical protein L211DRAFT_496314 [Terfezia boudieri ATCC MYA-4762]
MLVTRLLVSRSILQFSPDILLLTGCKQPPVTNRLLCPPTSSKYIGVEYIPAQTSATDSPGGREKPINAFSLVRNSVHCSRIVVQKGGVDLDTTELIMSADGYYIAYWYSSVSTLEHLGIHIHDSWPRSLRADPQSQERGQHSDPALRGY